MENPRAVTELGRSPGDLRSAYAGQQRGRAVRRHARKGYASIKGAVLGALLGAAAVFAFCVFDHQPFFWQTAAWEAALLGFAGCVLGRTGGGTIAGGVLFGLAYAGAIFLRDSTYNSTKVLQPYLPTLEVPLNGNFSMGASLVVAGAFLGYVNSLE